LIRGVRRSLHLAWRAYLRFRAHNGPDRAAAVAYYTLLSIVPMLLFVIWLGVLVLGSFDAAYRNSIQLFGGIVVHLSPESMAGLQEFVRRAGRFQWPALILLAWTARRIFASLFSALEMVFQSPSRGFLRGNLMAFGLVIVTGLAHLTSMFGATLLATVEGVVRRLAGPSAQVFDSLVGSFLAHVLPVGTTFAFFFVLYRVAPRRVVTTSHALLGATLATVLWELAKSGFAWYVRNLTHYAGLYGALEGVIVLALWLEVSVSIILFCGEIVALRIQEAAARVEQEAAPEALEEGAH
jgi:membrane protein